MKSITDQPIKSITEDLLKVERYSKALSLFIEESETPITIGLQGEWGTGKTSLMSLLRESLESKNIAISWVNTWEFSIFAGSNQTTPKVLAGMLEDLKQNCKESGNWVLDEEISDRLKKVTGFLGNIANTAVAIQTGVDVKTGFSNDSARSQIAIIKNEISRVIQKLVDDPNNPFGKIVFFVDDLDRINPNDAVEVLEALKNIFDIPKCVFVLAIDYDVVIKGLTEKFGEKSDENEREFRSFFDKIIQVPFSMPVGGYDIANLLIEKLKSAGVELSKDESEIYVKTLRLTVGANPRSLKRYLNSFSLIKNVISIESDSQNDEISDLMLFALLGIQIAYPQVFRIIATANDYVNWSTGLAGKYEIDLEEISKKISSYSDGERILDDDWEKIIWGICQKDVYLRSSALDVIQVLNLLRKQFPDNLLEELEKAIEFASITNVDDSFEVKQSNYRKKIKFDSIDSKLEQLRDANIPEKSIAPFAVFLKILSSVEDVDRFQLTLAKTGSSFYDNKLGRANRQMFYFYNPRKNFSGFQIIIKDNTDMVDFIDKKIRSEFPDYYEGNVVKGHDLILKPRIADAIGEEEYTELISEIANIVLNSRVAS